jgi:colanic acid biosynthesis glycosyl transferase WcaI
MRILILGINYFPERTSVGPFTTGLSEHLASQGHTVQIVTAFPYYPEWRIWDEYRGRITQKEVRDGVQIRRVRHYIPRRASSLPARLLHDFSFTAAALGAGLGAGACDVVYCSCPPPALALAAYALSRIKNVPYVVKLTDLASDAALATGILREGFLMRCARSMEKFVYERAQAVVCLCERFREELVQRGIPADRLHLIPDWGDTDAIHPCSSDGSFRDANRIGREKFVVLHTGNMGKKQDLLNVVHAAALSKDDSNLLWVIVGEGEERASVALEIGARRLDNLLLLPLQPVEALCQLYADADVLLLNQKAAVKDSVIPCKLLTYMASGQPILAAAHFGSVASRLVREARCGVVVQPENPADLVEGVRALRANRPLSAEMGLNGRAYAERNFNKARVLNLYDQFFESLLGPRPAFAGATERLLSRSPGIPSAPPRAKSISR